MKKFIWISLILLLIIGCGSRKKQLTKETVKSEIEQTGSGESQTDISSIKTSESNLSQFLENGNLKITGNGSPYQLQYGSLVFSGSADIELSEKKEKIIYQNRYTDYNVYHHFKVYETHTNHKTETTFKSVDLERKGLSFGSVILIVCLSLVTGAILWEFLKKFVTISIQKLLKIL